MEMVFYIVHVDDGDDESEFFSFFEMGWEMVLRLKSGGADKKNAMCVFFALSSDRFFLTTSARTSNGRSSQCFGMAGWEEEDMAALTKSQRAVVESVKRQVKINFSSEGWHIQANSIFDGGFLHPDCLSFNFILLI